MIFNESKIMSLTSSENQLQFTRKLKDNQIAKVPQEIAKDLKINFLCLLHLLV